MISTGFLMNHSHPNGFYWGKKCSLSLTPANSMEVSIMQQWWPQQKVTRPKARFKPTSPEKSWVNQVATYLVISTASPVLQITVGQFLRKMALRPATTSSSSGAGSKRSRIRIVATRSKVVSHLRRQNGTPPSSSRYRTSVTRLGDLLEIGQVFEAFGNN